jgi:hypothetical protein
MPTKYMLSPFGETIINNDIESYNNYFSMTYIGRSEGADCINV